MKNSMKLGRGGRFKKLKAALAARGDVKNPEAVAAKLGMEKYGKEKMLHMAHAGKMRKHHK